MKKGSVSRKIGEDSGIDDFFFELQYVFECVYDRGRIGSISVRILESGVLSIKDFNCTYFFLPIKY